jgi:hypothetical protein
MYLILLQALNGNEAVVLETPLLLFICMASALGRGLQRYGW